jgi:hypothetical protein
MQIAIVDVNEEHARARIGRTQYALRRQVAEAQLRVLLDGRGGENRDHNRRIFGTADRVVPGN